MSAKLQPPVHRLRLQAVFPETQDRAAGKVLQPLPAVSKGVGGGQAGGQVYRLRRRRGLPQRQGAAGGPGRPKIQQVVSPDGMGMDTGRLHPANRGGRAAPAGKIVLFFLPQHETRRDNRSAGAASRFVPPRPGAGGQRPEKPENGQGPGAELFLERTIWKGVLHTWQRLKKSAKTSKRRRRKFPPSRSAFGNWR